MLKVRQLNGWLFANVVTVSMLALTVLPLGKVQAQGPDDLNPEEILVAHNYYRRELGLPDLVWSDKVAESAQTWANYLAATETFEHSQGSVYGENLWRGTADASSQREMVDAWGSEKENFVFGTFPDVFRKGDWTSVGHYTQIIWKNTTEVGCGLASGGGNDILVCQYNPPGNYEGEQPYKK